MKKLTWLALAALLSFSCRKSEVTDSGEKPGAPAVRKSQISAGMGNPSQTDATDAAVNTRTRPLPRPEDPKHKPAPPLEKEPFPIAQAVPGKAGMVFSPYNNKLIDVSNMPPGTMVSDPTYPESERKYFRVP